MTRTRATEGTSRRGRGDGGSLTIELAFVAPVMIILLLGIFEFGTVYRNQILVANALRGAARVESQQPNTGSVDELALATFIAGTTGLRNMTLQRVVIYSADSTGQVPAGCKTATITGSPPYGVSGSCSVYNQTQVSAIAANPVSALVNFGCGGATTGTTWDGNWCPASRNTTMTEPMPRVGVYAVYTYKDVTNLFPTSTMTISDYAVFSLQPSV
jgi:Flp pilus assembly protein TadG